MQTLLLMRNRLEAVGVLALSNIFVADPDSLSWRIFHQATAPT